MSSLTQPCTECTDLFDCPLHQTPDSFMESDLLLDMDEYCVHCNNHCDPETHYHHSTCTYEDVYDYPEMHETMEHSIEDEQVEYKELDFSSRDLEREYEREEQL